MSITVRPLDATLGAVVTGVELRALDDDAWAAVEAAFHTHAVLVFPGQFLTEAEQEGFARRFGAIEAVAAGRAVVPISNQRRDGSLRSDDDPVMKTLEGNEGWHTDSSYMPVSSKAAMLSAHVVPSRGGRTEWADMRAAYDALDDAAKARIADLAAHHSIVRAQARIGQLASPGGPGGYGGYGHDVVEPPLRPLVKIHPVTGRPSLFIGRHAYGIPGMTPEASEELLDGLLAHACRAPRTYEHAWTPGDIAVWDNRCVLHRARPWDHAEARVMRHTRIAGDPVTERAIGFGPPVR